MLILHISDKSLGPSSQIAIQSRGVIFTAVSSSMSSWVIWLEGKDVVSSYARVLWLVNFLPIFFNSNTKYPIPWSIGMFEGPRQISLHRHLQTCHLACIIWMIWMLYLRVKSRVKSRYSSRINISEVISESILENPGLSYPSDSIGLLQSFR